MSERIEEIRETLDRRGLPEPQYVAWGEYKKSVSDLLERIDEQDRGLWEAAGEVDKLLNRIAELTRENERLRRECITWQEMAHSLIPNE